MYGYAYPRRPQLDTMIAKGPWRDAVDDELKRMAREASCAGI